MGNHKLLIWGTGIKGEKAYDILKQHRKYQIIAFGDNNHEQWGKKKYQLPIVSPNQTNIIKKMDGIVIASSQYSEIYDQLKNIVSVPIYNTIDDLMYTRIAIDISGFCNAKCKWCVTGRKNRKKKTIYNPYMFYDRFVRLYEHLYDSEIIEKSTEIMLYSWGEPLLNRDYVKIVEYLAEQKQKFSVSTNASVIKLINKRNGYENCCAFVFSMPGFSQKSYDSIHGFSFEQIKRNIIELNQNLREHGFHGDGNISFHIYQFNVHEIEAAESFAQSLSLRFNPYYPYFNGNSMATEFLEGKFTEEEKNDMKKELYLSHIDGLLSKRPKDYHCFLENIITIDFDSCLVLCCASDEDCENYKWGSVFDIRSLYEMRMKRKEMLKSNSCKICRRLGIDYWMENNPSFKKIDG